MRAPQSGRSKQSKPKVQDFMVEEDDGDFGKEFSNPQPAMARGFSVSSDLFDESTPKNENRGSKRAHQDDDYFNSDSNKRFKHN